MYLMRHPVMLGLTPCGPIGYNVLFISNGTLCILSYMYIVVGISVKL